MCAFYKFPTLAKPTEQPKLTDLPIYPAIDALNMNMDDQEVISFYKAAAAATRLIEKKDSYNRSDAKKLIAATCAYYVEFAL